MPLESYNPDKREETWQQYWEEQNIHRFDPESSEDTYVIDTPPPTVSGDIHIGTVYGHILQDLAARFHRLQGKNVLFPFGYDNNGIATERLAERELGIQRQDFSRRDFQEKVKQISQKYQDKFQNIMQRFGFSMDWENTYQTIESRVQKISQQSFLHLYEKGREYRKKAPAIWCPACETAISQVEVEDKEKQSYFNDIAFPLAHEDGEIIISTTRPELLPACVAIFIHPDDETHQDLVGKHALVPLFGHEVPILEDERVDMDTGTGIVMCCTFGDQTDIEWYQAHDLPLRVAIDESGTMTQVAEGYEGLSTEEAREKIVEDLEEENALRDRREHTHTVKIHERSCDGELEFLVTQQWYVKLLDKKDEYLQAGKDLNWYPDKMFTRYKHWIDGLQWDWCISRQRDSGIPFPVWYCTDCDEPILADTEQLPVDPLQDDPPADTCPNCGHETFEPEDDVFDTWATSSLTPLINARWNGDTCDWDTTYPLSMRPQGHDIISFWLFHTVVKCLEHTGETPFEDVLINGMVLGPNGREMSKSTGNVVEPIPKVNEYSADAMRFWAATYKPGDDLPCKDQDMVRGEKFMRKLWNAAKFTENHLHFEEPEELRPIDEWVLSHLHQTVEDAAKHYEQYRFDKAKKAVEQFTWHTFCDNYLEMAKQRVYNDDKAAAYTLTTVLRTVLPVAAPIIPHLTEEIYQELFQGREDAASLHTTQWPNLENLPFNEEMLRAGDDAVEAISALRKYKTERDMSMNQELGDVDLFVDRNHDLNHVLDTVKETMHVNRLTVTNEKPTAEKTIDSIELNYEALGPKYGDTLGAIEQAIQNEEYTVEDETVTVHLDQENITLEEDEATVSYDVTSTEGDIVQTENMLVLVKN